MKVCSLTSCCHAAPNQNSTISSFTLQDVCRLDVAAAQFMQRRFAGYAGTELGLRPSSRAGWLVLSGNGK